MKEFCGMAKIVSQIVSHGADHPPNSLPHRQLEMEAEVGIGEFPRDCEVNMPDFIGKSSLIVLTNLYPF
jgi:hypothetical protein